mmetsp:Transcript_69014/g.138791  ORF Transcript_69014/g.138791 Transcript_69014/m.138791 type:complete len:817 (+) Transcript_69014:1754-4204(+)
MADIRQECKLQGLVPLYHYTVPFIGPMILEGGFRMSTQGQGDGGVYFSTVGPAGYGLGTKDYERNIIIDCFGKERVDEYLGKGNLDVCLVYGCHPRVLIQAPGGRDNAKMVPKITFSDFAKPNRNGDYFLRPDKIFGAFQLGPTHLPRATEGSRLGMATEKQNDAEVKWSLAVSEQELKCNDLRNHPDSVAGLNPLPHVVEQLSYNEKMRSAIERLAEKAKGGDGSQELERLAALRSDVSTMLQDPDKVGTELEELEEEEAKTMALRAAGLVPELTELEKATELLAQVCAENPEDAGSSSDEDADEGGGKDGGGKEEEPSWQALLTSSDMAEFPNFNAGRVERISLRLVEWRSAHSEARKEVKRVRARKEHMRKVKSARQLVAAAKTAAFKQAREDKKLKERLALAPTRRGIRRSGGGGCMGENGNQSDIFTMVGKWVEITHLTAAVHGEDTVSKFNFERGVVEKVVGVQLSVALASGERFTTLHKYLRLLNEKEQASEQEVWDTIEMEEGVKKERARMKAARETAVRKAGMSQAERNAENEMERGDGGGVGGNDEKEVAVESRDEERARMELEFKQLKASRRKERHDLAARAAKQAVDEAVEEARRRRRESYRVHNDLRGEKSVAAVSPLSPFLRSSSKDEAAAAAAAAVGVDQNAEGNVVDKPGMKKKTDSVNNNAMMAEQQPPQQLKEEGQDSSCCSSSSSGRRKRVTKHGKRCVSGGVVSSEVAVGPGGVGCWHRAEKRRPRRQAQQPLRHFSIKQGKVVATKREASAEVERRSVGPEWRAHVTWWKLRSRPWSFPPRLLDGAIPRPHRRRS